MDITDRARTNIYFKRVPTADNVDCLCCNSVFKPTAQVGIQNCISRGVYNSISAQQELSANYLLLT
jgi:hypothetical protein